MFVISLRSAMHFCFPPGICMLVVVSFNLAIIIPNGSFCVAEISAHVLVQYILCKPYQLLITRKLGLLLTMDADSDMSWVCLR